MSSGLPRRMTFMGPCDQECFDLQITCSDHEVVYAHKCVLTSRCEYYRRLYEKSDVTTAPGRMTCTPFHQTSHCLKAMLQFFYRGSICELENNSVDMYIDVVTELFLRSLRPQYCHHGGLDDYLLAKLMNSPAEDAGAVVRRLQKVYGVWCNLEKSAMPAEQCAKPQAVVERMKEELSRHPFHRTCLRSLKHSHNDVLLLEMLLQDVALQAPEIEVAAAVALWASARPAFPASAGADNEESAADAALLEVDDRVLHLIDLECLTPVDLLEQLPKLHLYPRERIVKAKKEAVLRMWNQKKLNGSSCSVVTNGCNTRRGRHATTAVLDVESSTEGTTAVAIQPS